MKRLPITLGIARPLSGNPQTLSKAQLDLTLPSIMTAELKKTVHERDDHTCQCCGFRSLKYQEIHYLDQNRNNLRLDNLLTTCIFCHQCFNLDVATQMRSGVLIWLPEVSQTTLNSIMQALYVARISQGPMAEAARKALDALMARREEARRRIFTDDPFVLSAVLKDYLTSRYYADRSTKLDGIRLFPLDRRIIKETDLEFNQFPQILAYWRSKDGPFAGKAPSQWIDLYKKAFRGVDGLSDAA
jgi:intracellular multiplication protein IcmJ